ncbi:MAG TPA: AraC family transcriptional regulator [Clostridia bacterium]|nr:AraC family transcriptional regulator [Clostridia bacterium]
MLTDFRRDLEKNNRLETNYLRLLYYEFAQKYTGVYKSYEYNRLCTIIEGEKQVSVNQGAPFSYDSSQFLLMPPDSRIQMEINRPTKALVIELDDKLIKNVSEKISIDYSVDYDLLTQDRLLCGNGTPEIKISLNRILDILSKSKGNIEFLLDLYAQELVYNLIQIKGVDQVLNLELDNPIFKAVKYMKGNYMQPISIKQISSDLNMSEANFCQCFKRISGITPKDYLTNLKLAKAKDMLRYSNVTEVAFDLGYENISHFIALFKAKYGITPKQYKKTCDPLTSQ